MTTVTTILGTDKIKDSRAVVNSNFESLKDNKVENADFITEINSLDSQYWSAALTYNTNNVVLYNGVFYKSIIDNNYNFQPNINSTKWVNLGDGSSISWGQIAGDINNQTDLQDALDDKEPANSNIQAHISSTSNPHSVTKAQVGLTNVLDVAQIPAAEKGAANGVATLDAGSKIPQAQLPAIAITDTFVVASQAAMLALTTAEKGDVAVRTDLNKSFILTADPYSTLGNWQELLTPTDSVLSVNGNTGAVTIDKTSVGLGNVDNTSDATKNSAAVTLSNKTAIGVGRVPTLDIDVYKTSGNAGYLAEATATGNQAYYAAKNNIGSQTQLFHFGSTQTAYDVIKSGDGGIYNSGGDLDLVTEGNTNINIKSFGTGKINLLSDTIAKLNAPQGFLINGKIIRTVASNNLTVAIKTLAGTDPSASDPVYCRIGNTVRSITSALGWTQNAGTNYYNAGSAELATKEIDYFVYLEYVGSAVGLMVSRYPAGRIGSDFNLANFTSEKSRYGGCSGTDEVELIGRFNATLSAGAGYTWSIPATDIIINRPIFETRELDYVPTTAGVTIGNGTKTGKYKINNNRISILAGFKADSTTSFSGQITISSPFGNYNGLASNTGGRVPLTAWGQCAGQIYGFNGFAQETTGTLQPHTTASPAVAITNLVPGTWAANINNFVYAKADYQI
jgi:hypothetical protein